MLPAGSKKPILHSTQSLGQSLGQQVALRGGQTRSWRCFTNRGNALDEARWAVMKTLFERHHPQTLAHLQQFTVP